MDELFNTQLPGGEKPDIQLCIFPHLKEFLAIDLREQPAAVSLLNASDVFTEDFFGSVEEEISDTVRAETEFPFAHMINLPMQLEEAIRETAMTFILSRLGVRMDADSMPAVIVFVVSGGVLAARSDLVLDGLKQLLRDGCGDLAVEQWEHVLSRLIAEENRLVQKLNQNELAEALHGDSPDYFTLWENRN